MRNKKHKTKVKIKKMRKQQPKNEKKNNKWKTKSDLTNINVSMYCNFIKKCTKIFYMQGERS